MCLAERQMFLKACHLCFGGVCQLVLQAYDPYSWHIMHGLVGDSDIHLDNLRGRVRHRHDVPPPSGPDCKSFTACEWNWKCFLPTWTFIRFTIPQSNERFNVYEDHQQAAVHVQPSVFEVGQLLHWASWVLNHLHHSWRNHEARELPTPSGFHSDLFYGFSFTKCVLHWNVISLWVICNTNTPLKTGTYRWQR